MSTFYELPATPENCWRSIILFGRNVASYKFALAKAIYQVRHQSSDLIRLEELAPAFAKEICEHLKSCDTQATSAQSRFLDACRDFNANKITEAQLTEHTVRLGFNNVIDAFHIVRQGEVAVRFFEDERRTGGGIRLTENFLQLMEPNSSIGLIHEAEARWKLVETAWDLGITRNAVIVESDSVNQLLHARSQQRRRVNVTSVRDALNGYQQGRCFYCEQSISVNPGDELFSDVDHFFPHSLHVCAENKPINGVANLVLACPPCNRGPNGKFDRIPALKYLERLHTRNEYLIGSHHPLRETLIMQTGASEPNRRDFLQSAYNCAAQYNPINTKWDAI